MKFMTTEGKQSKVSEHEPIVELPMNDQHLNPTYDIPDQKRHILDVEQRRRKSLFVSPKHHCLQSLVL